MDKRPWWDKCTFAEDETLGNRMGEITHDSSLRLSHVGWIYITKHYPAHVHDTLSFKHKSVCCSISRIQVTSLIVFPVRCATKASSSNDCYLQVAAVPLTTYPQLAASILILKRLGSLDRRLTGPTKYRTPQRIVQALGSILEFSSASLSSNSKH